MRLALLLLFLATSSYAQFLSPGLDWSAVPTTAAQDPSTIAHPKYWWVSYDSTNQANVTNWTDRIQSLVLTNGTTGATRPTGTASGIHFAKASSQILTNIPGFTIQNSVADVGETIWIVFNADSLADFSDLFSDNGGNFSMGIHPANKFYFYKNPSFSSAQSMTTAHIIDLAITGNLTGTTTNIFWTNSVPMITNGVPPVFPAGDNFRQVGTSINGSWDGYILEIAVYSNQFLSLSQLQQLHTYATNKYGYTP